MVERILPIFFIGNRIKLSDTVHELKPDPVINLQDLNRFFDFFSALGVQTTHMLRNPFCSLGLPRLCRPIEEDSVSI